MDGVIIYLLFFQIFHNDLFSFQTVHFGGGTWGVIAVAFLDKEKGILLNAGTEAGYVSKY